MDARAKTLIERSDQLFQKKVTLLSLWQEIALNFFPARADFTFQRVLGTDFAEHLMTGYPMMAHRDLSNAFSTMLRPNSKDWFKIGINRDDLLDEPGRAWLEWASGLQRRAMYDRASQFVRATKEGDKDFAAFGQCAISLEYYRKENHLLFRNWHLRDMAWCENEAGKIDTIFRKCKYTARDVVAMFPKTASAEVKRLVEKDPYHEVDLLHAVIPADGYDAPVGQKFRTPYVSVYIDVESQTVLEETGAHSTVYIIPRWETVSGSQYARSPAIDAALPDARLLQAVTLTLLEAGEKYTNPPLLAVDEAIRSDIQVFAGGITRVDAEYDERLGEVLRPLSQDKSGFPIAVDMRKDIREMIAEALYLNKISMPSLQQNPEMTAFQAGQIVQEYIRNALPLFEPMEIEYNGALCDGVFDLLKRNGGFGNPRDIPQSIRGQEVTFRFESPLNDAIEAQKAGKLQEAKQALALVVDTDPGAALILDGKAALRDVYRGVGVPASWTRTEQQVSDMETAQKSSQLEDQALTGMERGAGIAKTLGEAAQTQAQNPNAMAA